MANKRKLVFVGLVLVALCLVGAGPVLAQGPEPFEIRIEVQEDGGWVLPSFGGLNLGLNSENFEALSKLLNLGMAAPEIDPQMVKVAMENDIKYLAVVKEGPKTTILINNQPLSALSIADPAIAGVAGLAPGLEDLIAGVNQANIVVLVLFPSAESVDLTARLEPKAEGTPTNTIQVGSTLSPQGELLSVGGIAVSELGMAPVKVDAAMLQKLGVNQLDAKLVAQGLTLSINDAQWLELDWDLDTMTTKVPALATSMSGGALDANTQQVLSVATEWLKDSQFNIRAYVAEEPKEEPLSIRIERPIVVEWSADNNLKIEGIPVANAGGLAAYRNQLQSVGVAWKGEDGKLYLTVNETQMPYLELGEGFLAGVGPVVGAPSGILKGAESVLRNSGLTLLLMPEGGTQPDVSLLDYDIEPGRRLLKVVPKVTISRKDGGVALDSSTLPLGIIEGLTGIPISQIVRQNAEVYGKGIEAATVVLGPDGLRLNINGGNAHLGWDNRLRDNLVNFAGDMLLGETPMGGGVGGALSTMPMRIEKRAIRGFLGLLNAFELGVEIKLQDEPLPAGFLMKRSS